MQDVNVQQEQSKKYFEVDLLNRDLYRRYVHNVELLKEDLLYQIRVKNIKLIFIDEVQKIADSFDVIHDLIESENVRFVVSGSSARKLKRGQANLLGGRARSMYTYPFLYTEFVNSQKKHFFKLEDVLRYGSIPGIFFKDQADKESLLKSYVDLYLKEEVLGEALIRNLPQFSRFLDVVAIFAGQIISYSNIAREASIPQSTVANYFQIIQDTLIGYMLPAWDRSVKRQLAKHSKFYLFDNGITNALLMQLKDTIHPEHRGVLFEQWLINEIRARISYSKSEFKLHYWRTSQGSHEVDLVLSKRNEIIFAIEIKAKNRIDKKDLRGLVELKSEYPNVKSYLVSEVVMPTIKEDVIVVNWREFLEEHLDSILL